MKRITKSISNFLNTRLGFVILAVFLYTLKTIYAYENKFNLGVKGSIQTFLMIINPIPIMLLLFGIALYMKGRKSYIFLLIVDFLDTVWLFSNILYYREFSDFLTMVLIKGSGSVSNNLGKSIMGIVKPTDFLVFIDVLVLILLLAFHVIKMDVKRLNWRIPVLVSSLAVLLFGANLTLAESDRSQLLTRTFDNNYIVKYLGLNVFNIYDMVKTTKTNAVKSQAKSSDIDSIEKYMKNNYVQPNVEYSGVAKGKNVFIIHLESLQQFMIDYKWDGQEVTPNLNKIYHENDTLSFDNFFNQVGQGKTADAELMLENSLFGLSEGSAMVTDGTSSTFQAAPAILDQDGYTTASFHGDVPSFWNRDNTYKSWGYDYFFSSNYFKQKKDYNVGYGMKDKIFLKDSAKYIEQLPQPFYAKLITVTNHYPYTLDKKNQSISKTKTGDSTVDGYVQTAHYLDQSIGEFMNWLKETGLEKNSMVVLYGDHYGISNNHNKAMAKLTGIKGFNDFNDAQYQRVPFMIHMDGLKGGINHTYGGEIDVLPTLLNLLGIDNKNMIQFGSDLLSSEHSQVVAFRNGDFVSPTVTKVGSTYYNTKTGKVDKNISQAEKSKLSNKVTTELSLSDRVINGDLLRFHKLPGFTTVNTKDYSYKKSKALKKLKKAQKKNGTSLLAQNDNKSMLDLYQTDAPELSSNK
ncbi:LTA synthase family protein [Lactobacillus halodurans]|uniref:LTA synthase family protein n=1 Tax=Companilactobacillus halodurans TaxID=2584183 RepID=A0A5P0ZNJ9_9LACO|nr:LTA synthase family protein [Companilactobacillus halodurans]MQS75788.1 LTA synthase family protein [Companilactobacillus halodurans]